MKKLRKILSLLLATMATFSIAGCQSNLTEEEKAQIAKIQDGVLTAAVISLCKVIDSADFLNIDAGLIPQLTDFGTVVVGYKKLSRNAEQGISQSDVVFRRETYILVIVFCCKIRRIAIKKAHRAVILPDELLKVFVFNHNLLQSASCHIYHREVRPDRMGLTAEAVKSACIAVSDKLIELCSPVIIPKSRKKSTFMQACNPLEVLTGIKDISQLVFQLVGVISDTAVQVHQIAVKIVV